MNLVQLIATTIIPVLVALFSSPKWPGGVRAFLAFALCIGLAIWQAHGQFGADTIENVFKVFALVQGLYLGLLKHIGLPALERGSAQAWTSLLQTIATGVSNSTVGDENSPDSIKERLAKLDELLQSNTITQAEYEQRRQAVLQEV